MQDKNIQQNLTLKFILQTKNLSPDLFNTQPNPALSLDSPLSEHVRWIFKNIYSIPYAQESSQTTEIAREIHGIQHVTRVAFYTQIFANLYRKHGDKEALDLTEEDIKLLQIAALFHDSGRENEGEDLTDHESGLLLYFYLRNALKVDKNKAKLIAEATANKDFDAGNKYPYFEINEDANGRVSSGFIFKSVPLTIYHKIIHDADCLDVIRARLSFDANYLYFYQCIASNPENKFAFEEMAHLINEARSLIHIQGDTFERIILEIKKKFEHENAFDALKNSIDKERHPILSALGNDLMSLEEIRKINLLKPKSDEKFQQAMDDCQLFVRSIGSPSAIMKNKPSKPEETAAQLENRKTMRTPNIASRTNKSDNKNKHGNLNRSISVLGYGTPPFADAGAIIIGLNMDSLTKVSPVDFGSGRGKKEGLVKEFVNQPELLKKALIELEKTIKMGGKTSENSFSNHTELLYKMTKIDAFYYCNSPNLYSSHLLFDTIERLEQSSHKFSPILQAIYLQKQYEIQYEETLKIHEKTFGKEAGHAQFIERFGSNKTLPILEYSAEHHEIRIVKENELTEEKIIEMWTEMCSSYMKKMLFSSTKNMKCLRAVYYADINAIKTCSMYGSIEGQWEGTKYHAPADANYDPFLVQKINQSIEKKREEIIHEHELNLIKIIQSGAFTILSENIISSCNESPFLQGALKKEIFQEIEKGMQLLDQNGTNLLEKDKMKYFRQIKEYCKIYNLEDHLNTIHNKTTKIFFELFNKTQLEFFALTPQLKPCKISLKHIGNLLDFINNFDLQQPALEHVESLMSKVFVYSSEKFTKFNNISEYANIVEKMHQHGFLKPEHDSLIKRVYEKSKEFIENDEYSFFDLQCHLEVEKFVKDSPENIINTLSNWLENTDESLQEKHQFKLFLKYSNDTKLFKKLLNKINLPTAIHDISWIKIIMKLNSLKKFDSEQNNLLMKKWDQCCTQYAEFTNNIIEKELSFASFIDVLIKARYAELPADILESRLELILKEEYHNFIAFKESHMNSILPYFSEIDWLAKESGKPEFLSLIENLKTLNKAFSESDFSNPIFFQDGKLHLRNQPLSKFTIEKFLLPVIEHYANEIEVLDLSSCKLNNESFYPLALAIGRLKHLKILNISDNAIDNTGAEHLVDMLQHGIDLNINENVCDPEDIQESLDKKFMKKESQLHLNFFTQVETGQTKPMQTFKGFYQ